MRRLAFLPLAVIVAACSSPQAPQPEKQPKPQAAATGPAPANAALGSHEWYQWVDRRLHVSDDHAHGPDYGSTEWNDAVQRKLGQEAPQAQPGSPEWQQAVDALLRTRMP